MKKLFLFLLLVGFVACSVNISDFGSKWVSVSTRNIIIDTCTINISTGMLDSVRTSNSENIFVGNFEDKYFGKTKSVGYFIFRRGFRLKKADLISIIISFILLCVCNVIKALI